MDPEQKDFLLVLLYLYLQHGKHEKARKVLDILRNFYPDDPHIIRCSGYLLFEEGKSEEALKEANRVLEFNDANVHDKAFGLLLKSRAYWNLDKKSEAEKCLVALAKTGETFE